LPALASVSERGRLLPAWVALLLLSGLLLSAPLSVALSDPPGAIALALWLSSAVLYALAARLALAFGGSRFLAIVPTGVAINWLVIQLAAGLHLETWLAIVALLLLGPCCGGVLAGLIEVATRNWRGSAVAGLSLAFGALLLAICDDVVGAVDLPAADSLMLAGGVLALGILLVWRLERSAAAQALAIAKAYPSLTGSIALDPDPLAWRLCAVAGGLAVLAATPLALAPAVAVDGDLLALSIAIVAAVVIAGSARASETLAVLVPMVALPAALSRLVPALDDLSLPAALAGLVLATCLSPGRLPGGRTADGIVR